MRRFKKGLQRSVKYLARLWYPFCRVKNFFRREEEIRILMYHKVSDLPQEEKVPYCNTSIAAFEAQMKYLAEKKTAVVSLEEVGRWLNGEGIQDQGPKAPKVVITFDDGFQDNYLYAYPILKKYRLPAAFCVLAGHVGRPGFFDHLQWDGPSLADREAHPEHWRPMTWEMLQEMKENGMTIGSHTLSHRSLGALNPEEVWEEVAGSKQILDDRLKQETRAFSYPFGSVVYGDLNDRTEAALKKAGYDLALTTRWKGNKRSESRYRLSRIPVYDHDTLLDFKCKIYGATDWLGALKNFWQRSMKREDRTAFEPTIRNEPSAGEQPL